MLIVKKKNKCGKQKEEGIKKKMKSTAPPPGAIHC
jgi:hypothetical protein